MLSRSLFAYALALASLAPLGVSAAPTPPAHNGGMLTARIASVDYQRGSLAVDAGARGRLTVAVMPSTSIQSTDGAYHTIIDLKPGQRVEIFSSVAGDAYVAQIIRILP